MATFVVVLPAAAPTSTLPTATAADSTVSTGDGNLTLTYSVNPSTLPVGGGSVTYTYTIKDVGSHSEYFRTNFLTDSACSNIVRTSPAPSIVETAMWPGSTFVYTCTTTITQTTVSTASIDLYHWNDSGSAQIDSTGSTTQTVTVGAASTTTTGGTTTTSSMVAIDCTVPKVWDAASKGTSHSSATTLYQQYQSPSTAVFQAIGTNATISYNSLAYNPADNFLYAVQNDDATGGGGQGSGELLKIDANGAIADLGNLGTYAFQASFSYTAAQVKTYFTDEELGNYNQTVNGTTVTEYGDFNTGVFSADGKTYYISNGSGSGNGYVFAVNLANKTISMVNQHYAPVNDWTWKDGYLWGITTSGSNPGGLSGSGPWMGRLNPATGVLDWFSLAGVLASGTTYGAAWTYGNGNLGFDDNNGTGYYQIAVANDTGASPTFTLVAHGSGPASYNNDGTACSGPNNADLAITKTAASKVLTGSTVTFTFHVTNNGPGYSSGGVVTDTVPTGYTNVTATTNFASVCTVSGNKVTCTTGALNPGAGYDITITATAPTSATCLTNTATVLGNEKDGTSGNNTSSEQTCATADRIDIAKSAKTTVANGPDANGVYSIQYAVTVTNSGAAAATYTQVTDNPLFTTGASIQKVTWQGGPASAAETTVTANSAGLYPIGSSTSKALAAGATDTYVVTVYFTVPTSTSSDLTDCGTPSNPGMGLYNTVGLAEETLVSTNNSACANPMPGINVVKTVVASGATGPGTAHTMSIVPGASVDYYYQVTIPDGFNEPLKTVGVTDDKCSNVQQQYQSGSTTLNSGDTNGNGLLDPGETWMFTCTQTLTTTTTNVATASGTGNVSSKTVTDTDTDTVTMIAPSINLVKAVSGNATTPDASGNSVVTYTITASNSTAAPGSYGPIQDTPAFGPDLAITKFEWQAPASSTWTTATAASGSYAVGTSHTLAGNASEVYTVRVTYHWTKTASVTADTTCGGVNTALYNSVTAAGETGSTSDNAACTTPPTAPVPGLALAKSVKSIADTNGNGYNDAGDVITYQFTVTNTGSLTLAPVTITDTLLNLSGWQCVASLAPGASATCVATTTWTITAADVTAGDVENTATATGTPPNNLPDVPTTPSTTDTPVAPVGSAVLTKTDAGSGKALQGAVYSLYVATASVWSGTTMAPPASTCQAAATGTATKTGLTTDASGRIQLADLKLSNYDYAKYETTTSGSYTVYCLVETKAPAGYNLQAQPNTFTVSSSSTPVAVTAKDVVHNLANALPTAGGTGTHTASLAGLALVAAGGAVALGRRRRP